MRITAMALVLSLVCVSTNAFAQEAADWRKVAETVQLGSKVKVHTTDGKSIKGTLMRVDETALMVKKNTRRPEPAVSIPFDRVRNLERDNGGGFSVGKAIAI